MGQPQDMPRKPGDRLGGMAVLLHVGVHETACVEETGEGRRGGAGGGEPPSIWPVVLRLWPADPFSDINQEKVNVDELVSPTCLLPAGGQESHRPAALSPKHPLACRGAQGPAPDVVY